MNKILTEAVIAQTKKGIMFELLLKETLTNPIFKNAKRFQNEIEVDLMYEIGGTFGRAPTLRGISVPMGGSGMYGIATRPFGRLAQALKDSDMDNTQKLDDLAAGLNNVMAAVDPVVEFIDSTDDQIKIQANVLLAKVYVYITRLTSMVVAANQELRRILPVTFNPKKAKEQMQAAMERAKQAEVEADEYEAKSKEGFGSKVLKGIKRIFGMNEINTLNEGLMSTLLNPGHGELDKFTSKVDAFIDSSIEKCDELIKESSDLLEEDLYRLPQAGERSRLLLELVGLLKKYKCNLETIPFELRQRMG